MSHGHREVPVSRTYIVKGRRYKVIGQAELKPYKAPFAQQLLVTGSIAFVAILAILLLAATHGGHAPINVIHHW